MLKSISRRRIRSILAARALIRNIRMYLILYGTMDTPDAKGDSVIIYMSDSGRSPYYTVKDSTNKDNEKWQMAIVQNKADNAKTWDYAFREK